MPPLPPLSGGTPGAGAPRPQGLLGGPLMGPAVAGGPAQCREFSIRPRTGFDIRGGRKTETLPSGETVNVDIATTGIILNIRSVDVEGKATEMLDIEADRLVLWTRSAAGQGINRLALHAGRRDQSGYGILSLRKCGAPFANGKDERTLRADEVYYDVSRNVAVAMKGDLEFHQTGVPDPIHLRADELDQLSPTLFKAQKGEFFSSRLPSDPGLTVVFTDATLEDKQIPMRSIFGNQVINRLTGRPETVTEASSMPTMFFLKLEHLPVFFLPFVSGDVQHTTRPHSIHHRRLQQDLRRDLASAWTSSTCSASTLCPAPTGVSMSMR